MKVVGYIILGIVGFVLLVALAFALEVGGLKWKSYFAPKHENVRREVFTSTRSFNEAKTQDLARYRLQYLKASPEDKSAIGSTIRIMFADYDDSKLPDELSWFLKDIRGY